MLAPSPPLKPPGLDKIFCYHNITTNGELASESQLAYGQRRLNVQCTAIDRQIAESMDPGNSCCAAVDLQQAVDIETGTGREIGFTCQMQDRAGGDVHRAGAV